MRVEHLDKKIKKCLNNRGAALMVAVIIIGVLLVFTLSLLLVSYSLYASQNKNAASIRCSEAANTLSEALEKELTDSNAYANSDLWNYLRYNLVQENTWPYYDSDGSVGHTKEDAYRYFNIMLNNNEFYTNRNNAVAGSDTPEGYPGQVELCIYWEPPQGYNPEEYTSDKLLNLDQMHMQEIRLTVEVTCEAGNQSYTVVNRYLLNVEMLTSMIEQEKLAENATLKNNSVGVYNPLGFTSYHHEWKWTWIFDSRE